LWISTGSSVSCAFLALGQRHQRKPLLAALRRIGAIARVEQRQPRRALGCLAQDLVGDVAAHRQPRQREPRGRRSQDRLGDRRHRIMTRVVGHRHVGDIAERRRLRGPECLGAQEARHQHEICCSGHIASEARFFRCICI
jgi:hypothetical protein